LTIVDINPISFVLAHRYFDLPDELPCIVSDFRKFVFDDRAYYDGIAIDVGGPGFRFTEEFDAETCDAIRARLAPGGRIVMNVMVAHDIDPTPDRIAARLAGEELRTWIVDEQFIEDRNAVIACIPEKTLGSRAALDRVMRHSHERWAIRRGRLRSRDLACGLR
jgi:spermidine synthase